MKYTVYYENPSLRFLKISLEFKVQSQQPYVDVQLPSWRPGRYELGNFAKNIVSFKVSNEKKQVLQARKIKKDRWSIETQQSKSIRIDYVYFASELNAGSTYLSENQLYMNPANCLLYVDEFRFQKHTLEILIPNNYHIACGLKSHKNILTAASYDELIDCPLIARNFFHKHTWIQNKTKFHIWISGNCKPDFIKIEKDFKAYINVQHDIFKSYPFEEYHFLYHLLDKNYYHGVEHQNSTVIVLGPGYNLMDPKEYEDFMGISSHEFFHAWNIKAIRPIEMYPYDYTRENYSPLGYVAEGVTTYYGDLCLCRSGYFSTEKYLSLLAENFTKYMDNEGRNNMSVAEASIDTWLDGYSKGVPHRKVSIYNEGSLLAFMTDTLLRKSSNNKNSLDDVMRDLYQLFAQKNKGYSEQDYWDIIHEKGLKNTTEIIQKFVWGTVNYRSIFEECLSFFGLVLIEKANERIAEQRLGLKLSDAGTVLNVHPNSPAWKSGITFGDILISIEAKEVKANPSAVEKWLSYYAKQKKIKLNVLRDDKTKEIEFILDKKSYYPKFQIQPSQKLSKQQSINLKNWLKNSQGL